jgi:dihydropyrimidine dehydrogenase (NAD+) subunit PreA
VDGFELNFGCPHGMSERGMGSAVGQVPEYVQMVTEWCKKYTSLPVIVKLTPNITNILHPAKAAKAGGADAVSLINTINSIMRIDYDSLTMYPTTDGMGTHGGYCGEAVKPIALNMVAEIARTEETRDIPISGIGGITTWRDAVDYFALGATTVQVCTAAMVHGFKIVEGLIDGLNDFLDQKGMASVHELVRKAIPSVTEWKYLNLNRIEKAVINQDTCIGCGKCHIACEDTAHQAITNMVDGQRKFVVKEDQCVGCNLCVSVCPVENCITMKPLNGGVDPRTGLPVVSEPANWTSHPNNPLKMKTA